VTHKLYASAGIILALQFTEFSCKLRSYFVTLEIYADAFSFWITVSNRPTARVLSYPAYRYTKDAKKN